MQVKLKSLHAHSATGQEVRVWMETWAGDQFERFSPQQYENFLIAIATINKHFPNAILLDEIDYTTANRLRLSKPLAKGLTTQER